jgi:PIN domain nuclease of toxin-antitoxin system
MISAILVDTHLIIWMRTRPEVLTLEERRVLDTTVRRFISAVTLWEIALLQNIGRLPTDRRLLDVPDGFELLPVKPDHCSAYADLPRLHRDPFDRMLIAQARVEKLALLTRDAEIPKYGREGCTTLTAGSGANANN